MALQRAEFATDDPELAEEMIRRLYIDQGLSISGRSADFTFGHSSLVVAGRHGFALDRLHHTFRGNDHAEPTGDLLVADAPRRGSLQVSDSREYDSVAVGPGEVLLSAPTGGFSAQFDNLDFDATALSHRDVAEHAVARCGIAPESLRFTAMAPITPDAGRLWIDTVAHVRDDILTDPEIAAMPMVLENAFQTLATTMLATFPNTALDATRNPLGHTPGQVSDTAVGNVVDFLHQHAGQPLGPVDIAEVADAPARDVDEALRRRRNTTLAEQLWRVRMQGAFRDLYDGDPAAGDTVAAVAARWGFTNPRTFAAAYTMSTGGETPDDTLRR
jgi:AraC-like DNA-binding protein